ncbi:MAG: 30S ribosomal protein S1 [Clostridiales bacterium]
METAAELDINNVRGVKRLGVTAGASTPDWIIEEVVEQMTELEKTQECAVGEENIEKETCEHEDALDQAVVPAIEDQIVYQQPVAEADAEPGEEAVLAEQGEAEEKSLEDTFAEEYGDMKEIRRGARVKGVVVQVKDDELLVDIGGKSEGVLSSSELTPDDAKNIHDRFAVGDEIDVLILRRENQEGYPILSKKRVDQDIAWDKLAQKKIDKEIVSGIVTEVVKGGVLVDVGLRGFVPASLVGLGYVEDLTAYIGKELQMKIIDCDKHNNKLVLSAKAVLRKASQSQKEKTWAEIAEGQTRHGVVRRLTNFGAFVDIGGVDGLLHVSEMAWYRVNHPADLLKEGDELDVFILGVDAENEKISLGLKQLTPNPWSLVAEKYPEGSVITAKVMRTTTFGAFLEVEPGVEGLVHISQMAHQRVEKTEDVVKPGDMVQVKVLSVDPEAKRMSLSIKATLPKDGLLAEETQDGAMENAVENMTEDTMEDTVEEAPTAE